MKNTGGRNRINPKFPRFTAEKKFYLEHTLKYTRARQKMPKIGKT